MNKSKYITYTTMALVAFIIIEMNLFTFMFVKGQDEKEYKFEYGTVMDVRGALGIKFLIETESGKRIFVYSNKTLLVGDKVIVKEYKEKYCLSSVQIPLHRITDSASNGSVFPVVTEHFSASSDHAFL